MASIVDYFWFGNALKHHHIVGITFIVVGVALIGLRNVINPPKEVIASIYEKEPLPIIYPILLGLTTPIFFVSGG